MKWVTRARPKTDRIACPWLIRRFIDPDAEIVYVAAHQVLTVAEREGAHSFDAPGARYEHRHGGCTFETLIAEYGLGGDPALTRLARIVHAADIDEELGSDPAGPGLLAMGLGGLDVEPDDYELLERASFVYDALYAFGAPARGRRGDRMSGEHLEHDAIRADRVRQVGKLMAAAAITALKSGGQLFLAGQAQLHRDRHRRRLGTRSELAVP